MPKKSYNAGDIDFGDAPDTSSISTDNIDFGLGTPSQSQQQIASQPTASTSPGNSVFGMLKDVGSAALTNYVSPALKAVDSVTGAPVRAAVQAYHNAPSGGLIQTPVGPLPTNGLVEAAKAYGHQFGANPDQAPTPKDLAAGLGIPTTPASQYAPGLFTDDQSKEPYKFKKGGLLDVSPAGVAGLPIGVATDPLSYIPVGELASAAANKLGSGLKKVSSTLTGVPEHVLNTYSENLPEISQQIAKYGENTAQAADDIKSEINSALQEARMNANNTISARLGTAGPEDLVDGNKVLENLAHEKSLLDPDIDVDAISNVNDMMAQTQKKMDANGLIALQDAYNLKRKVYGSVASGSYLKNGQIYPTSSDAQRIAKGAAANMVSAIEPVAPEITLADGIHSELHDLEDTMNSNIIKEGKSDAALTGAGSSASNPNRAILDRISSLTGTDVTSLADKYAAQKMFTKTPLLPVDTTGKSATRLGLAAGAGWMASHNPAVAGLVGAAASPAVAQKAIQGAGLLGQLGINPSNTAQALRFGVNAQRQGLLSQ
jgi:hypothetical protein